MNANAGCAVTPNRCAETDVDRAVTEICATVTSPLGPDQWQRYFPGRKYESTCPERADSELRNAPTEAPTGSTSLAASNSGMCVVIKDDGAPIGAPAHQFDCTGVLGEKWTLRDAPAAAAGNTGDHLVGIVNAASGMCLESADAERKFGDATQIVQRPCTPATARSSGFSTCCNGGRTRPTSSSSDSSTATA